MKEENSLVSSTEVGSLGVLHLKRLWSRVTSHQSRPRNGDRANEWDLDRVVIHGLGLSLEETLQYLAQQAPGYSEFEHWILQKNEGTIDRTCIDRINSAISGTSYSKAVQEQIEEIESAAPVLSADDLSFWKENGYVIVHDAVSKENCEAAEGSIWEFMGADSSDPDTWYKTPGTYGIMLQFFHHPALAANRRSQRIRKAFAQIWRTADLWVTVDRVSFNPPERDGWRFPGPHLHWDTRLDPPIPFGVSGLLYLTDTSADQGAFRCVLGFHRRISHWLKSLPADADPRRQDLERLGAIPIAGKSGDLIIWTKSLPHGSGPNRARLPRIAQYIAMHPTHARLVGKDLPTIPKA
ncbi:MAG TPA: phytanoyl-CoA dioxygenase family protein [Pyrinomonadaceae bacterium]